MTILERFSEGDIRALSKVISHIEDRADDYRKLLGRLYKMSRNSVRVGITGPPGAGKSTLVNGLVHEYLKDNKKIGVVAVDPTSPFTGGALLGDRVRMNDFPAGGQVYFRSMATRGASGGLSAATGNVIVALDAFGFDVILVETVGVGQVELDIIDACDTVVVTVVPESGDAVQTMKAGLMEIADVFVVNKADRPSAERLATDLKQMLQTKVVKEGAWKIPIVNTVAIDRKNVDHLREKIDSHLSFIKGNGQFDSHRRQQIKKKIQNILISRFKSEFIEKLEDGLQLDEAVEIVCKGELDPYEASESLYKS